MTVSSHLLKGLLPTLPTSHSHFRYISLMKLCQLTTGAISLLVLTLFLKTSNINLLLLLIVFLGLLFNTQALLLGNHLGISEQLKSLNRWRYLIHDLCVPLLAVVAVEIAHYASTPWLQLSSVRYSAWILALFVGATSFIADYFNLDLRPEESEGLLLYRPTAVILPVPAILTSLYLIAIGWSLWHQAHWPWLFCAAILSFGANAAPNQIIGRLITTVSELGLMVVLLQSVLQFSS